MTTTVTARSSWPNGTAKWVKSSDWIEPIKEEVQPLMEQAAKDYAASNAGWPKRNEACDKSS